MNNQKLENAINTYKKHIAENGEIEAIKERKERKEYYQSWTIEKIKKETPVIIIDIHAEATAEKICMAKYYAKLGVSGIFGTHPHVQTADEQIFPQGTAYITDLGMTGPKNSVIGMDVQVSFKRFETALPEKYKIAEGECILNAVKFEIDDNTNKVTAIKKIFINE